MACGHIVTSVFGANTCESAKSGSRLLRHVWKQVRRSKKRLQSNRRRRKPWGKSASGSWQRRCRGKGSGSGVSWSCVGHSWYGTRRRDALLIRDAIFNHLSREEPLNSARLWMIEHCNQQPTGRSSAYVSSFYVCVLIPATCWCDVNSGRIFAWTWWWKAGGIHCHKPVLGQ